MTRRQTPRGPDVRTYGTESASPAPAGASDPDDGPDGTCHPESASPARAGASEPPARGPRTRARSARSVLNRSAYASRQGAADLRRSVRALPEDDPHRVQALAVAEQFEAFADAWERERPPVPARRRRGPGRAPARVLTFEEVAELEGAGIDVFGLRASGHGATPTTSEPWRS